MFYTIYQITNTLNGKIYIGKHQTKLLNDGYMGSGKIVKAAMAKHGSTHFQKQILHVFDNEAEMNAKEAELVTEEFCRREDTYNLCVGGKGGFSYINETGIAKFRGKKHSEESKKKMGHLGNTNFKGKTHSEATKKLIGQQSSQRLQGHKKTEETKRKISESVKRSLAVKAGLVFNGEHSSLPS